MLSADLIMSCLLKKKIKKEMCDKKQEKNMLESLREKGSSLPLNITKLLLNHQARWQFLLCRKAVWPLIQTDLGLQTV